MPTCMFTVKVAPIGPILIFIMYGISNNYRVENIVEEASMNRVVRIILLALISITALSGCLVEKKDLKKIARTTDNLRVYQAGDTITYNVTATSIPNLGGAPFSQAGTLSINWTTPSSPLIRPGSASAIPQVIKETTILSLGGTSDPGTVRYISQDADGQVTLHALEDSAGVLYWLSSTGVPNLPAINTESFITFISEPFPLGIEFGPDPYEFYVMQGCEDSNCDNSIGRFSDNPDVVGDTVSVTSNLGVFQNPFQINFTGSTAVTISTLPVFFDIRDICGKTGPLITHGTGGAGTMYVMPEIGMIRMDNTCVDSNPSGNTVHYTITISNTNIPLP